LTSFKGGLDLLITRLGERLQVVIKMDRLVTRVAWNEGMWEIWGQAGRRILARNLVCACPTFLRVYRWRRAIPQYTLGHIARRARLEELAQRRPGLHLVGNAFYGVGLNDCVKMAYRVAQEIQTSDH
jgi:hypothetical protein